MVSAASPVSFDFAARSASSRKGYRVVTADPYTAHQR
jgi:hypothetical protein